MRERSTFMMDFNVEKGLGEEKPTPKGVE